MKDVKRLYSKREGNFLFSLFSFFLLNLKQQAKCVYYVRLKNKNIGSSRYKECEMLFL